MGVNETKYRAAEVRMWAQAGVTPEERWLPLRRSGTKVRLQVIGEGPPVLFVHGASVAGTYWAPLAARLDGWQRLVLDRPGCGLSEPPPERFGDVAAYGAFADALLVDVLDALELERADLVANSLGGYMALRTAAAHPDRVGRIVECGWTVGAPIERTPLVLRVLGGLPRLARLLTRLPVSERMTRNMLRQAGLAEALEAGRVPQETVDWWRAMLNDTDTMRNELGGAPPVVHPIRGVNDSLLLDDDLLQRVTAPVSFIWGTGDPFGGEAVAVPFADRLPAATLELVPGGHAVWLDDPERAAVATRAALSRALQSS